MVNNFAYGDAVRHLHDNGLTAEEIHKKLDYPVSVEKIQAVINDYEKKKSSSDYEYEYIQQQDKYGRKSYIKVVIKKKNNELVYELNETDQSACSAILTSEYPGWVYVSADKVKVTKNDIVKLTITSDKKIKNYNLAKENVTVKVGSEIQEEDTVKEINCTNGNKLVCEIKIEGLKGTGNINVGISKETLIDEDGNKSRGTVLNTNVKVDNNGPTIKYISKSSTNKDDKYSTAADTVTIKVKVEDEDEIVGEIEENEIKVYVEGIETSATKEVSKDELEYTIKIKNITGNGVLTLKILADSIADELGNTNKEKIISPGIKIDNIKPTIEYSQEGSEEILSKIAVTIKANDNETGIDNESLKYIYGTNENALVVNTYANESEVTLENQTGEYYLIAEACDNAGNCRGTGVGRPAARGHLQKKCRSIYRGACLARQRI